MKKEKQKEQSPEFVLGEKIRDVKINERQHFTLFVSLLIFFNVLMIASAWFVLMYLTEWYYWIVCVFLVAVCCALSFRSYLHVKSFHKCSLHDNALSIKSIWINLDIEYKHIYEIIVKESILDKIFKLNTKSLELHMMGIKRKKFTLHFIEENAVKLKQEITMLIDKDGGKDIHEEVVKQTKTKRKKNTD